MPSNVSMMGTAPDKLCVNVACAQRRLCPSYKAARLHPRVFRMKVWGEGAV
uniref:Uncharacterized protein n=1 Tax=Candidatus Kentrum sp. DK TaxID=2126562 RepID=A0A450TCI7_9GAMM|nr:MAG: hypothetical protein BECKDK2373B_GA0170837_11383 [Candidatus Kentron sp. DK]